MNSSMIDKLSQVNLSNGKFVSDKSYAYDTIYFIAKFIIDYQENGFFDLAKWRGTLIDYIAEKWQLLEKNDGLLNYYHETISLLEYAHVIEKERNKTIRIVDSNLMNFITRDDKMENAYIFIYLLCYFTIKNSGCLELYVNFCKSNISAEKKDYINEIYNHLCGLNGSIRYPEFHDQWSKQNTQYIMNVLNFINKQPWVSREFTFDYTKLYKPSMISVNVRGTKTKYDKKNDYLENFDYNYVINNLNDYIIGNGVE